VGRLTVNQHDALMIDEECVASLGAQLGHRFADVSAPELYREDTGDRLSAHHW